MQIKYVAIIGAGERGVYYIGTKLVELAHETHIRIAGVYDTLPDRAQYGADYLNGLYKSMGIDNNVVVFPTLHAAVHADGIDLVQITTHTDQHIEAVRAAAGAGRKIYLDKPISVSLEHADEIAGVAKIHPVMMGFTRRYEMPWIETVRLAHDREIGTPQMILLRSVIPYTRYFQLWHRNQSRSGGALNDKGTHHMDVLGWIAGAEAQYVNAIGGRSGIFAPRQDMPARCSECHRDCPYRRHETLVDKYEGAEQVPNASWLDADDVQNRNDNCVWSPGSDIDDHAVITVKFANGITACVFFTIFGPWSEDQETLEIVGSSGRVMLERHSGHIDLIKNHGRARHKIDLRNPDRGSSHFGADRRLVREMRAFIDGHMPPVGVHEGRQSLRVVQAAQKSLDLGGHPIDPRTQQRITA